MDEQRGEGGLDLRRAGCLFAWGVAVWFAWDTRAIYPLKVLVVIFHELSHGLAAIATGGSIVRVVIEAGEGGACLTQGGLRVVVLSAGYLGSLFVGGTLLVLAARSRWDRFVSGCLGLALVALAALYIRPFTGFGFLFTAGVGLAILLLSRKCSEEVNEAFLLVVGLTSTLYAILDIKDDILDRPDAESDARLLAQATGVPTLLWGVAWGAVAVVAALCFIWTASQRDRGAPGAGDPPR